MCIHIHIYIYTIYVAAALAGNSEIIWDGKIHFTIKKLSIILKYHNTFWWNKTFFIGISCLNIDNFNVKVPTFTFRGGYSLETSQTNC